MTMSPHPELDQLSAYLDGELETSERNAVEVHLPTCAECRATLDALRATIADLATLPEPVPTEQDSWALRAAITRARVPVKRWHRAAWAAGAVAAAVVAIVAIVRPGGVGLSDKALAPAGADRAAAGASAANIQFDAGSFTASSAQAKLLVLSGKAESDQINQTALTASSPAPNAGGGGAAPGAQGLPQDSAGTTNLSFSAARSEETTTQIDHCVSQIQKSTQDLLQPVEYDVGTFESKPAFLLFFRTASRYELWVVQRPSCDTLYFAQAA